MHRHEHSLIFPLFVALVIWNIISSITNDTFWSLVLCLFGFTLWCKNFSQEARAAKQERNRRAALKESLDKSEKAEVVKYPADQPKTTGNIDRPDGEWREADFWDFLKKCDHRGKFYSKTKRLYIISSFGAYVEKYTYQGQIYDQSKLPHPKGDIFNAICLELIHNDYPERQEALLTGIALLSFFQEDFGENVDLSVLDISAFAREDTQNYIEKYRKFFKMAEDEYKIMNTQVSQAIEFGRIMPAAFKKQFFDKLGS